ncbi:UDP-N-acetylglucosamine--dolichyl-phosphate N-acetylglucosaminephosphotransferase [Pseudoscourfieldia marina]
MRKNLVGRDINKKGTQGGEGSVPEAIGLAPGIVLVSGALVYQTLMLTLRTDTTPYDEAWHMEFNAGVVSVLFMVLLGFVDDVLDIPWRAKIVLPVFSALPLLASYRHGTDVVVPPPLRAYVPEVPGISVDGIFYLGPIYKFYMVLVVVFCSNSINILAAYMQRRGSWPKLRHRHRRTCAQPAERLQRRQKHCRKSHAVRIHASAVSRRHVRSFNAQLVSVKGICRRYVHVHCGYVPRRCGRSRALQRDYAHILCTAGVQLYLQRASAAEDRSLSTPSPSNLRHENGSTDCNAQL